MSRRMFTSLEMGLVTCPKLREGSHGFKEGTRFLRESFVELIPHAYASSCIVESHCINELYA